MSDFKRAKGKSELEADFAELRRDIDEIDSELVQLLCERFDTALELSAQKRALGLPVEDLERESCVLARIREKSVTEYSHRVEAVFRSIIASSKAVQRERLNLYFIGMPNCGKTRLASRIGEILGIKSVDMDELIIERSGKSIDRIFDEDGEERFRELESEVLTDIAYRGGIIAATGGGIITREQNIPVLKSSGLVVFLDRNIENLKRARVKNRPLIREGEQAVLKLYEERLESYRRTADLTVDPDAKGTIRTIIRAYQRALRR